MGTGSTGGGNGDIRPTETILDGEIARDHVDDRTRHEKWRDPPCTAFKQSVVILLDQRQSANPGADGDTDTLGILLAAFETCITDSLRTSRHAILNEEIHLARIFRIQVRSDIEILDRTAEASIKTSGIKMLDGGYTALSGNNALPTLLDGVAHRCDQSKASHYNSTSHQLSSRHLDVTAHPQTAIARIIPDDSRTWAARRI